MISLKEIAIQSLLSYVDKNQIDEKYLLLTGVPDVEKYFQKYSIEEKFTVAVCNNHNDVADYYFNLYLNSYDDKLSTARMQFNFELIFNIIHMSMKDNNYDALRYITNIFNYIYSTFISIQHSIIIFIEAVHTNNIKYISIVMRIIFSIMPSFNRLDIASIIMNEDNEYVLEQLTNITNGFFIRKCEIAEIAKQEGNLKYIRLYDKI